ncbi:hypothetical protein ARMSODRAFT_983283 [Armillaria solidipes]|uniref:Uncharacterized protein n=1 Tax=Armillaria solidipes TaxID=1076256 RepID=A0A2H3AW87_9AGAR|nr:hypothetical protein ARMSODRAFT_983283 [Armillaria solidipes]
MPNPSFAFNLECKSEAYRENRLGKRMRQANVYSDKWDFAMGEDRDDGVDQKGVGSITANVGQESKPYHLSLFYDSRNSYRRTMRALGVARIPTVTCVFGQPFRSSPVVRSLHCTITSICLANPAIRFQRQKIQTTLSSHGSARWQALIHIRLKRWLVKLGTQIRNLKLSGDFHHQPFALLVTSKELNMRSEYSTGIFIVHAYHLQLIIVRKLPAEHTPGS